MKQFNGNQLGERYTIETEYYLAEIKIKNKRENVVNFIFFSSANKWRPTGAWTERGLGWEKNEINAWKSD